MYAIGNYFSLFLRSAVTKCSPFERNAHAIAEDIKIGFCGKTFHTEQPRGEETRPPRLD